MSEEWVSPIGDFVADDIAKWDATDAEFRARRRQMRPYAELAKLIVRHRTREGLSQQELALRVGRTTATISRLESGRHRPSAETLRRLAKALGGRLALTLAVPERSGRGNGAR